MMMHERRDAAHAEWDRRQDFTMLNRRQTAKAGFIAGWHLRKTAELEHALGLPVARVFGKGWEGQAREEQAAMATAEGRNWFRDKSGKIWIDVPNDAMTSFGIPTPTPITPDEALALYRMGYWSKEDVLADIKTFLDSNPNGR